MPARKTSFLSRLFSTAVALSLASVPAFPGFANSLSIATEDSAEGSVISIDFAKLIRSSSGEQVQLKVGHLLDSTVLTTSRVVKGESGAQTWVGYDAKGGMLTRSYITSYQGAVTGALHLGNKRFELLPVVGSPQRVRLVDYEAQDLVRHVGRVSDVLQRPTPVPTQDTSEVSAVSAPGHDSLKALPSPQVQVDLAVLYTSGMVTKYGSVAGVMSRLTTLVQIANDAYTNSEVAITLNLVGAQQSTFANTGDNNTALLDMTGKVQAACAYSGCADVSPLPVVAVEARALRESVGADLVSLIRPFSVATNGSCGVAWNYQKLPGATFAVDTAFGAQFGYSVVSDGSDSGYICFTDTLTHELGHNMGLAHDRPNSINPQTNLPLPGVTAYAFGVGFNYPPATPTRAALGDIMSYATSAVPFFSSPNVTCNISAGTCQLGGVGTPLGAAGDTDTGACTTNPATCADNSRALNYTRVTISSFRTRPLLTIAGTVNNSGPLQGVAFCAKPAAGVSCSPSLPSGSYTCTVPAGWSGQLHAAGPAGFRMLPQTFSNVTANLTNQNPVFQAIGACNLDVDNNGLIDPQVDGVAILRRMMGASASAFSDLVGQSCAANTSATAIFNATSGNYNVTAGTSTTTLVRDGMVILRAMQGLTGNNVTNGLSLNQETGAANTTWPQLQSWLNSTCGTSF